MDTNIPANKPLSHAAVTDTRLRNTFVDNQMTTGRVLPASAVVQNPNVDFQQFNAELQKLKCSNDTLNGFKKCASMNDLANWQQQFAEAQ